MDTVKFTNDLALRRKQVVELLANLYLFAGVLGTLVAIINLFSNHLSTAERSVNIIVSLLITGIIIFIRYVRIKRDVIGSFIIMSLVPMALAFGLMYYNGISNSIGSILLALVIVSSSIVLGVRRSIHIAIFMVAAVLIIFILHTSKLVPYTASNTVTNLPITVIVIFFVCLIVYITRIGYGQIEHSYQQAYDYAKELEELNKNLDAQVQKRTRQLEESFRRQAESVHSAAVMGRITKAMLHDIATPISSLKGAFTLLKSEKFDAEDQEILQMANQSLLQMIRIIDNGRDLMDGKRIIEDFYPNEIISTALLLSRHELMREGIKVSMNIPAEIKIHGIAAIFERIVVNLIVNAVEELRQCPPEKRRQIDVLGEDVGEYFKLTITDSGRGIPPEYIERIFEPDFSLKNTNSNLGFGLPFVKANIKVSFSGEVEVKSEMGDYTSFILTFKKLNDEIPTSQGTHISA